jgi:hypothetical protein
LGRNADIEMRWVDAWNDLNDLVGKNPKVVCQLPDWSVVSVDECLGWLQESVYEGYRVRVESGWINGRVGVIAHRDRPD